MENSAFNFNQDKQYLCCNIGFHGSQVPIILRIYGRFDSTRTLPFFFLSPRSHDPCLNIRFLLLQYDPVERCGFAWYIVASLQNFAKVSTTNYYNDAFIPVNK